MDLGIDASQLARYVIRPTLEYIGWSSPAAERLVLGTGITESRLRYIKQLGSGPALGIYQMEPATFADINENYLRYRPEGRRIEDLRDGRITTKAEEVIYNLVYATAMTRAHYRRQTESLPNENDAMGMAQYWKDHYNTHLGAGDSLEALPHFQHAIDVFSGI
jgi:hypothetical protein